MTSSWLGAWLLWWTWYAAELRGYAATLELFAAYETPEFSRLHAATLRESPIMRALRGQQ